MKVSLVVKDYGLMDFFERMKEAKSVYSEVGLLDDSAKGQHKREGSDLTVAQIGSVQEFGSNHIPARPFLRPTFDENKQTLAKSLTDAMYDFVFAKNKMTPEKALGIASAKLVSLTRTKITNGIAPENAPSTLIAKAMKGKGVKAAEMRVYRAIGAANKEMTLSGGKHGPMSRDQVERETFKRIGRLEAAQRSYGDVLAGSFANVKPLIDTGRMLNSITWIVKRK